MSTLDPPISEAASAAPRERAAATHAVRPFYWSIRRELWENRSIFIAPAAIAGVILLGLVLSVGRLSKAAHLVVDGAPVQAAQAVAIPFEFTAFAILFTAFLVGFFYCLGALHGERRDRSILFWKSLPVSDATSVLAKAVVALVVIPVVAFVIVLVTQLILFAVGAAILFSADLPAAAVWSQFPLVNAILTLAYTQVVIVLWYPPVAGWLLLVSGWARRVPILWAAGVPLALAIVEKIAFNTDYVWHTIASRLGDAHDLAFKPGTRDQLSVDPSLMDPLRFFSSFELWAGLVVAAAFITAAIWQRRYRTPL
jgi:ABC-2 type transport system permease protein